MSNYGRYFSIFLIELEIYCQDGFHKVNLLTKKCNNQNKKNNSIKKIKIKLDHFRYNGKKKKLRGHFWELHKELLGGGAFGGGADEKDSIERLCLSPYVEEPLNSKVIKRFVPELRSRYVFFEF